ncbi:septum formation initiator family protein, partial [Clostridium saudiense]|nr:septum formation initiator family protein [Clostridium saudiense]
EKKEENRKLQAELERVQSNYDYLEKLARERLGLIKEGEQIILPSEPQE